jgi:flagellar L-ring protein precursor FlgH
MIKNNKSLTRSSLPLAGILAAAVFLGRGCNGTGRQTTPMPPHGHPAGVHRAGGAVNNPGSLFSEASSHYIFDDNRARKVGDIVLVMWLLP